MHNIWEFNLSLSGKWCWRRIVCGKEFVKGDGGTNYICLGWFGGWSRFDNNLVWEVGNGNKTFCVCLWLWWWWWGGDCCTILISLF